MASSQNRKESQFAGAAKIFQKLDQTKTNSKPSASAKPKPDGISHRTQMDMHGSLNNIYSPKQTKYNASVSDASLKPPPFVSPGRTSGQSWSKGSSQYPASSFLDDSTRTPSQRSKPKVPMHGLGGLVMSPSPASDTKQKVKVEGKSWKGQISFQASPSPGAFKKKTLQPAFSHHLGASFLSLSESTSKFGRGDSFNFEDTPDVKIEVKIPDIDKKIRARKESSRSQVNVEKEENVPEWLVKQRQREANVRRKQQEKEDTAAATIQALFLAWKARAQYPKLLLENQDRIRAMRERERIQKLKNRQAMIIQKTWRMILPRKRYLYLRECRLRKERNEKEIKRIVKVIAKMPKNTKAEIKEMKKEYAAKKTDMKKRIKQMLKEDEKRLEAINNSGRGMIEYLKSENEKLREKQVAMKNEYHLLEKQFEVLTLTSNEISKNFSSLQGYVQKKSASIQKNEINSQKCRHRYLPKYRELIKERDRHCIVEHRIRFLYKGRLEEIVELLSRNCKDSDLVEDVMEAMAYLQHDLDNMPPVSVPDGLSSKL